MIRSATMLFLVTTLTAGPGAAQGTGRMAMDAHPALEVVAIRLSDPALHRQGINADGHRMMLHGQTVTSMMMFAYGLHSSQIVEGPGWRSDDKYDVDGVVDDPGQPSIQQMQEIVQKMLAAQFGLRLHHAKRDVTHYAVVEMKGGLKMPTCVDPRAQPDNSGKGIPGGIEMKFNNFTVAHFALAMQYFMDRPLVDTTGRQEMFDFTLKWAPDDAASADGTGPPSIFTAVQEQLGLKLEARKGPIDVVVVDGLERPSGN